MKIFICSYNRPGRISVHKLLDADGIDYRIILHDEEQKAAYLKNPSIKPEKLIVANKPPGMTRIRRWVLDTLVEPGEWYLMLDDNITEFQVVKDSHYGQELLPAKESPAFYKDIFENPVPAKRFMECVEEMRVKAEEIGAYHCGFASNANFFFRERKWRTVGYVIGKATMTRKSDINYEPGVEAMDDYLFTAQNLLRFGRVLINNFVLPVKKHYDVGGIGTYEMRLPAKIADGQYLMARFPGLFRYVKKAGKPLEAELALRFTSEKQVEKWRNTYVKNSQEK